MSVTLDKELKEDTAYWHVVNAKILFSFQCFDVIVLHTIR